MNQPTIHEIIVENLKNLLKLDTNKANFVADQIAHDIEKFHEKQRGTGQ